MNRALLAPLVLALGLAQPAAAEVGAVFSKTDAILGAPSKLAALIARQNGQPLDFTAAALPQPASRGRLDFSSPAPTIGVAPATDRPDVFGTVALRVEQTPFDARWKRVRSGRAPSASTAWAASLGGREEMDRIEAINRFVNARVSFTDDSRQYRRPDVWQTASDTLRRGRGDCEDYAIAKLQLLRASGIADDDLYFVIVKDLARRADHAVLVVRTGERLLLLDNATDRLTDATAYQDYRPVLSYAAGGRAWTHGYRREAPPVSIAAGPFAATPIASLAVSTLK